MRTSSPSPPPCPHILDVLQRSSKHRQNQQKQVDGHIKHLSKSLSFSHDVFSRTYPSHHPTDTYVSARQRARDLFSSRNMPVQIHTPKHSALLSGRHNPRGSGSKHLPCYLDNSPTKGVTVPTVSQLKGREYNIVPYNKESPQESSHGEVSVADTSYPNALMGGAKPLYPSDSTIWLDNGRRYRKTVQQVFPQALGNYILGKRETWQTKEKGKVEHTRSQRWLELPRPTKSSRHEWVLRSPTETPSRLLQKQESIATPEIKTTEGQEFFKIMKEWASQRQLHLQLKDVQAPDVLVRDMKSLCNRVKMTAVLSVVLLAEASPPDIVLPDQLLSSLEDLLADMEDTHVRVPSAIALHTINKHSDKAQHVLLLALQETSEGLVEEAWAAGQCLVHAGYHGAPIIHYLLQHLFNEHSPNKQCRAGELLVKISMHTSLVFHMLVDRLNTSGWRERLITCKLLPCLHGNMSMDLCSKLLVCMWEDWSPEVRDAAAQALGCTGHGKMIHDEIAARLANGSEMVKLDAIRKLHSLKLMTSRLLPGYLTCFTDEHRSIQMEALAVAASIKLQHPQVFKAIKLLLQESRVWAIKVCALRALGQIGKCDQELIQLLVWMVRFAKEPAVRAEACCTIGLLGLKEMVVIDSLKSLVTVEDDPMVVQTARKTLQDLDQTQAVSDEMLASVCKTVRELGTKETISNTIFDTGTQEMANYVLDERPNRTITARDYLDHKCRSKVYGSVTSSRAVPNVSNKKPTESPEWGPDRKFIDSQLATIRTKLQCLKN